MPPAASVGGYGTRVYLIPPNGIDKAQILKGSGYVTIGLQAVHYHTQGNFWQKWFGGSDKVALSSQVTHISGPNTTSTSSIEDHRKIDVGKSVYFGILGRWLTLNLPTDCDGVQVDVTMTALENDNLSAALDILNGDELKSTLQLAPPAVQAGIALANVVKKLLTPVGPQDKLVATYAGRVTSAASDQPLQHLCLMQGVLILLYREADDDTSLDSLDWAKFSIDNDGLKYQGQPVQNTYVLLNISFEEIRGEDYQSDWSQVFAGAENSLNDLLTAADDGERQKIWAASTASYKQGVKLLSADRTYTHSEAIGVAASHLKAMKDQYLSITGKPAPGGVVARGLIAQRVGLQADVELSPDNVDELASQYLEKLSRSNLTLPGRPR